MSKATKQHFELIARVLRKQRDFHNEHASTAVSTHFKRSPEAVRRAKAQVAAIDDVALHMADALSGTNPAFDRARFLKACGVQS